VPGSSCKLRADALGILSGCCIVSCDYQQLHCDLPVSSSIPKPITFMGHDNCFSRKQKGKRGEGAAHTHVQEFPLQIQLC